MLRRRQFIYFLSVAKCVALFEADLSMSRKNGDQLFKIAQIMCGGPVQIQVISMCPLNVFSLEQFSNAMSIKLKKKFYKNILCRNISCARVAMLGSLPAVQYVRQAVVLFSS